MSHTPILHNLNLVPQRFNEPIHARELLLDLTGHLVEPIFEMRFHTINFILDLPILLRGSFVDFFNMVSHLIDDRFYPLNSLVYLTISIMFDPHLILIRLILRILNIRRSHFPFQEIHSSSTLPMRQLRLVEHLILVVLLGFACEQLCGVLIGDLGFGCDGLIAL